MPRVLVDIRHEATHNELPQLPALRLAADAALSWLKTYYWNNQAHALTTALTTVVDCIQRLLDVAAVSVGKDNNEEEEVEEEEEEEVGAASAANGMPPSTPNTWRAAVGAIKAVAPPFAADTIAHALLLVTATGDWHRHVAVMPMVVDGWLVRRWPTLAHAMVHALVQHIGAMGDEVAMVGGGGGVLGGNQDDVKGGDTTTTNTNHNNVRSAITWWLQWVVGRQDVTGRALCNMLRQLLHMHASALTHNTTAHNTTPGGGHTPITPATSLPCLSMRGHAIGTLAVALVTRPDIQQHQGLMMLCRDALGVVEAVRTAVQQCGVDTVVRENTVVAVDGVLNTLTAQLDHAHALVTMLQQRENDNTGVNMVQQSNFSVTMLHQGERAEHSNIVNGGVGQQGDCGKGAGLRRVTEWSACPLGALPTTY